MKFIRNIKKKLKQLFYSIEKRNDYQKKLGISVRDLNLLKKVKLSYQKDTTLKLFGNPVIFSAPFWFLHSLKEIFIDEVYQFTASKEKLQIIDCGANIGLSVIYLKKLFPNASITAIEPDKKVFSQLEYNLSNFDFTNVELFNAAAWINYEPISFESDGGLGGKITDKADTSTFVNTVRLKDLLRNQIIFFLKMDIEGAEYEVLKDIKEELKNVENLFVEFHTGFGEKNKLAEILSWIDEAGFKYYIKEAWNNMPNPFVGTYKGGYHMQLNIFCFR